MFKDVYRYEISSDSWTALPSMNKGRFSLSSCVMGNYIYVFGGYGESNLETAIERLAFADPRTGETCAEWTILEVSLDIQQSVVAPLNSDEILLLKDNNGSAILNVNTMAREELILPKEARGLAFYSNQH